MEYDYGDRLPLDFELEMDFHLVQKIEKKKLSPQLY